MLPTRVATFRICGEPNRRVIAWISGSVSRENASSCVQVTLAPTERTSPIAGDPRQLAQAGEAQEDRRLEPLLVPLDAQLGAARDDDRARMSGLEGDGVLQPSRAEEDPPAGLDPERRIGARGQLVVHHAATDRGSTTAAPVAPSTAIAGFEDRQIARASAEVAGEARPQGALVHARPRTRRRPPSRRRTPACRIRTASRGGRSSPAGSGSGRPAGVRPSIVTTCVPSSW